MDQIRSSRFLWGVLLILGGIAALLQNMDLFSGQSILWGVLVGLAGLGFLYYVVTNRQYWWAVIPGLVLTYTGVLIILGDYAPAFASRLGGSIMLGVIGLAFIIIYLLQPAFWWAIIPAGVMVTLMAVSAVGQYVAGIQTGGLFFLGLGLTFAILALIPGLAGRNRWPLIPAAVLIIIGLLLTAAAVDIFKYLWPIALILVGLWLFFLRRPTRSQDK